MANDPYKYFRIEARELSVQLERAALELEKGARPDVVASMLRHAHTLKGAARVVRQPAIADRAHAIEDLLAPFRSGDTAPGKAQVTQLLGVIDEIGTLIAAIPNPDAAPASQPAPARAAEEAPLVVRADLVDMDALLDSVGETATHLDAVQASADALARARQLVDMLATPLRGGRDVEKRQAIVDQLRDELQRCQRELQSGLQATTRELGDVREAAERLRLVAAGSLFSILERTARDAAQATGKRVEVETLGGEVRLDPQVLATVQGALIQLVRNAVAHGIEPERERAAARKPAAGRVTIEIVRRGSKVLFACRDDGRGVDLAAVRRAADERGVSVPDGGDASELVALLLRGGISTTARVTEVAGRGIGLDVVRAAVEKIGGSIRVDSKPGLGTSFELTVPVSLASIDALCAECGGITVALPLDAVQTARRIQPSDVSRTATGERLLETGEAVSLLPLRALLPGASQPVNGERVAIVLASEGRRAAIAVDRLLGTSAVVVRPVPDSAALEPIVAGAALDARGTPRLVLDPAQLVAAALRERVLAQDSAPAKLSVLVIDDSLTTRMLEQSILELAGYDVDVAVSGEQGLEAARRKRYALILVDVEMPGIDGFTFIERIRADPALHDIPAILVTSRSSAEDRARGTEVGAQGYIVKSEFDQVDLLARIQRLVRNHA